ncbi:MAG TPA: glycerol-3-phosphate 1-O-acyltransferase PlsY [Rhizomicrobium sp.]|jgi:glycerol-3-phosphate acyltransferase PlsY|nr:glycerol-3-phosphate 1-O-acyltransferase PlsY [Rhizomicrobium sp.]
MIGQVSLLSGLEALILGYLLGSIPFGLLFAYASGGGDVRKIGSGGIGATNVLRTGKYWAAAATLIFDAAKGAVAILIARHFWGESAGLVAALAALLGHLFPAWLGFKGGKGVATAFGVLLALYWPAALLAAATWLIVAIITRISSLSALVTAVAAPAYMALFHQPEYVVVATVIAILVIFMHRANIRRLLNGEEPRIGSKNKKPQ